MILVDYFPFIIRKLQITFKAFKKMNTLLYYTKIIFLVLLMQACTSTKNNSKNNQEMSKKTTLKVGDKLPSFTLTDQNGNSFSIQDIIGKKSIVIYFYPKDETTVCTAQACSFRDSYEDFKDLGAEVVGISSDDEESHKNFAENHRLPFILLSDSKQEVRNAFGVPKDMLGMIPGRYTYVVNKKGEVILVFNSAFNAQKHIDAALKALK